ncbi:MAG: hypothetical protein H0W72_03840 [Planctomycetes bacterium]|nr:hypothetical protein [Planctomycetota bacterium]
MKPTPHLLAAAAIVLIAVAIAAQGLFSGGGSYPTEVSELKLAGGTPQPVPASTATAPLSLAHASGAEGVNPFTLRKLSGRTAVSLALPPPPPLTPPAPPVLPLTER